jgi:hypothetical protein
MSSEHLTNPAAGYLNGAPPFNKNNIKWTIDDSTQVIVFNNIEYDSRHSEVKADTNFHCLYHYENGIYWTEVYERIYRNK